mmetsp:Transcript_20119/g.51023  ORF Transcript_20119/g.51023 Transcript_20119/m.51023 type:complete len:99 (-) Transcript_20119:140-436(-)
MIEVVKVVAERERQDEEDLADCPDEFLDPILSTLMEDPVILPTSNTVMDRAVITRHLLTDPKDPFNRAPLSQDDLQPCTELKAKIDEWRARKRQRRNA